MRLRKYIYYGAKSIVGSRSPAIYEDRIRQFHAGVDSDTANRALSRLLLHCRANVPYYEPLLAGMESADLRNDPLSALATLPVLSRAILAAEFEKLKSRDLERRRWRINTSGGSTGEPVRLIQDEEYRAGASANTLLFSALCGKQPGESEVKLWGSERDIFENGLGAKARIQNTLTNTCILNAFRMTRDKMREYVQVLNETRPRLILAYAQALFELAQFAEEERIPVASQHAVITSAGTLHPFMKEAIQRVFCCPVYNRYGSREVGDIACELPVELGPPRGLWVSPWGSYVEVLDDNDNPVNTGVEGRILVTSLANYAMPLLRYDIGDMGALAPSGPTLTGQVLQHVSGRVTDNFRTADGRIVPGEYFIHLIGVVLNTGTIRKFQLQQRAYDHVCLRIVPKDVHIETAEIVDKIRLVMGAACRVEIEFLAEIPPSSSGKYRYTVCEVGP